MNIEAEVLQQTISKLVNHEVFSDIQLAPNGQLISCLSTRRYRTAESLHYSRICLFDLINDTRTQLNVQYDSDDYSPRWLPDSKHLVFISNRGNSGKLNIFIYNTESKNLTQLTDLRGDIPYFRNLSLLKCITPSKIGFLLTQPVDNPNPKLSCGDRFESKPFTQHYVLDLETKQCEIASPDGVQIWEFAWNNSADKFAALISDTPSEAGWYHAEVGIFGAGRELYDIYKPCHQVTNLLWSIDDQRIFYIEGISSDRGIVGGDIHYINLSDKTTNKLKCQIEKISFTYIQNLPEIPHRLLFVGYQEGNAVIGQIDINSGDISVFVSGQFALADDFSPKCSVSHDCHKIAFIREDAQNPTSVNLYDCMQSKTTLIAQKDALPFYNQTEVINWNSNDGQHIQGILIRPRNSQTVHPMVVCIHGGPHAIWGHRYYINTWLQLLVESGFAVLLPNPRGSLGWGTGFSSNNLGDLGGGDYYDILTGISYCIDHSFVDPERVGVFGWSYGGFMSAWSVTQSSLFKVAVVGAGITNWLSFHGTSELYTWDRLALKNTPYSLDSIYLQRSPILHIKNVTAPTLILHGEKDSVVPLSQSFEFHRALRENSVPSEICVYSDQDHELESIEAVIDCSLRSADWFCKWLNPSQLTKTSIK